MISLRSGAKKYALLALLAASGETWGGVRLDGPNHNQVSFAVEKNTRLTETKNLELRAGFFNSAQSPEFRIGINKRIHRVSGPCRQRGWNKHDLGAIAVDTARVKVERQTRFQGWRMTAIREAPLDGC